MTPIRFSALDPVTTHTHTGPERASCSTTGCLFTPAHLPWAFYCGCESNTENISAVFIHTGKSWITTHTRTQCSITVKTTAAVYSLYLSSPDTDIKQV